jgi:hypothetical protein
MNILLIGAKDPKGRRGQNTGGRLPKQNGMHCPHTNLIGQLLKGPRDGR